MAKIHLTKAQWGNASFKDGNKVKPGVRKPRDASEGRRWAANSKKGKSKVISRKAASKLSSRLNRP